MISPSLPLIKEDLGSSFSDTQMVLSIYFLFLAVGQLFAGPLSDRFGRKPLVIYGSLIFSVSSLACSFSNDISVLILLRTIQGIGAAACFAVGRNIISDSFNRSEAASKMSTVTPRQRWRVSSTTLGPKTVYRYLGDFSHSRVGLVDLVGVGLEGLVGFRGDQTSTESELNLNRIRQTKRKNEDEKQRRENN